MSRSVADAPIVDSQALAEIAQKAPVAATALARAQRSYKPEEAPMKSVERALLGLALLLLPLLLLTQMIAVWPAVIVAAEKAKPVQVTWLFGLVQSAPSADATLFGMVAMVGALASLAESSFRFVTHAGRGELSNRWLWSYCLRPVQGAILAVIVYFALRGGLLGNDRNAPQNPYGIAGFAGLVGLFTRQAFQKLKEVFNTLWGVDDPDVSIKVPSKDRPPAAAAHAKPPAAADGKGS